MKTDANTFKNLNTYLESEIPGDLARCTSRTVKLPVRAHFFQTPRCFRRW